MHLYLTLAYLLAALSSCDHCPLKNDNPIEQKIEDITENLIEETFNVDVELDLSPENENGY